MSECLYSDEDVDLVAAATEQHHIVAGRTNAMGDNPCVCDQWWDSSGMPGWDEHMAEVSLAALAAAGRLRPTGVERFHLGDLAATDTKVGGRIEGRVVRIADDGMVTIAVPQGELVPPMEVTAPAREFAKVEDRRLDKTAEMASLAGYELGRSDERAELERAGRLLPADAQTEIEFLRAELARHRAAALAIRDTAPLMDAPQWRRLTDRAMAAGYEPSVVTRFQRKPDSLGHTNIVAAYQQGWWDCVALAETTRARPVSSENTEEAKG